MEERCCPKKNREGEHGGEQTNTPKGVCSCSFANNRRTMFVNVRCSLKMFACSGDFLPPSPPAEKATTREDQAGQGSTGDRAGDSNAGNESIRSCPERKRCAGDCCRGCDA